MIPTKHKDRNPSKEPYVMSATEVSDLLLGIPQYNDLMIAFIYYSTPEYRNVIHGKSNSSIEVLSIAYRENYQNNPYELYTPWYVCISSLTSDKKSIVRTMIQERKEDILKTCKHLYKICDQGDCILYVHYCYHTNEIEISYYQNGQTLKI